MTEAEKWKSIAMLLLGVLAVVFVIIIAETGGFQ
jgi:hypothetical protein